MGRCFMVVGRHAQRIASAILVLGLSAQPFLEAAHAARVDHVTCPEDGELVDAAPQRPQIAHSDEGGALLPAQSSPSDHRHDHCCLAAGIRTSARTSPARPSSRLRSVQSPAMRWPAGDAPRPARFALYLLAPKVSPPLV